MIMIQRPELFGLSSGDKTLPVRAGMMLVGLWWFVFSIPTFLWVKDKPRVSVSTEKTVSSFRQLASTFRAIRQRPELFQFLLAYVIYDDGVQTVILMASIFGAKALGMSTGQLALCFLMIQFVAFVGALVCGRLADGWSHKKVILSTLTVYIGVIIWGAVMTSQRQFWLLGAIVGLILGGTQAASRSLFALMTPPEKSSEFFAFFSIIGKVGALVGPFVFGLVSQFYGLRAGVASLLFFFIVGGGILLGVIESPAYDNSRK
jgi:UMF1 family MFS transporter